jgi:hypothetical protein
MNLYERIKGMSLDEMVIEIEKIVMWDNKHVDQAKKNPEGLKGAIKMVLSDEIID